MTTVFEEIPERLKPAADAALVWLKDRDGKDYELTAIVDPEASLEADGSGELTLILCHGDTCSKQRLRVDSSRGSFGFEAVTEDAPAVPPELDPPSGLRSNWIDQQLERYAFIVLLYYRGRW